MRLLKEYIRSVIQEVNSGSPDVSSLGAIVRDYGDQKEVILFRYDMIYSALSRRTPDDNVFDFLVDNIKKCVVGYGVFGPPDEGEAYGAWEVTHSAGRGYGKIIYGMGYALSPRGLLMPSRTEGEVSPDAVDAWQKAFKDRQTLKLDDLPPNNKTDTPKDDANLHKDPKADFLDYAYKEQGWESSTTARLIAQGNTALKELSADVNRDENAIRNVFISAGTHLFRDNYDAMLTRTRK